MAACRRRSSASTAPWRRRPSPGAAAFWSRPASLPPSVPPPTCWPRSPTGAGRTADLRVALIAEAWPKFLAGDVKGYEATIVDRLAREKGDAEVIVLAQASMAGAAAEAERRLGLPVLTSPRLGVTAAIAAWRQAQG